MPKSKEKTTKTNKSKSPDLDNKKPVKKKPNKKENVQKKMAKTVKREIHNIDLSEKVFGRAASEIAKILSGKNKVEYEPHKDLGDFVVAYNFKNVVFKGNFKKENKKYYRHSWYPGGITETSLKDELKKDFNKVFVRAVYKMLPKNKLRKGMIQRLKVKKGSL